MSECKVECVGLTTFLESLLGVKLVGLSIEIGGSN
jgi:hypothetical protein